MSEWKELDISNLPPDILVGDYEFEYVGKYSSWHESAVYRYRKPEPLPPTHEEIMTKWWKDDFGGWGKVEYYNSGFYRIRVISSLSIETGNRKADIRLSETEPIDCTKDWFTGRESADIPPEV